MKVSIFQRLTRFLVALLSLAILAGCLAPEAKVDPTRTVMMVTFAVAPKGIDGMVTSKTIECNFRKQASVEKAKEYEVNPGLVVEENACIEFDDKKNLRLAQLAVQGSPQMAGELTKSAVTAATGGAVNFIVQRALQRKQGEICAAGGCITTVNNNLNVNNNRNSAQGGHAQGGAGGLALAANENTNTTEVGVGVGVDVSVQGAGNPGNCVTGCK